MSEMNTNPNTHRAARFGWLWDALLILILLAGAVMRFTGINWDDYTHLHPDERFLTMVTSALEPVKSMGDYFNTAQSSLNPYNKGYTFYVYGDLPIIITRYVGEWLAQSGYNEVHLVGRQLSAFVDLLTVLLVYLIANRLYRKSALSVLAAAFAAFEVLPIQQAHFFTVDTFANFFGFLAFYFAARLLPTVWKKTRAVDVVENNNEELPVPEAETLLLDEPALVETAADAVEGAESRPLTPIEPLAAAEALFERGTALAFKEWGSVIPYVLFGAALGMAVASKINAAALAVLLPLAALIRWLNLDQEQRERWAIVYARNLMIGGIVTILFFRICQPYAFTGPGFLGFTPDPNWVKSINEQRNQANGDIDFPPSLQWARRAFVLFPFQNMVVWGLGLPLGILAVGGFFWMLWRMIRGDWQRHALVWAWTALYFAWQASSWNPTMRYLLLIYPSLAIIAAWAIVAAWERGRDSLSRWARTIRWGAVTVGVVSVALTAAWALAFLQIYTHPLTRVEASRWIYQNVPGPINLSIQTADQGVVNQPLAFRSGFSIQPQAPLTLAFTPRLSSPVMKISFDHLASPTNAVKNLTATISSTADGAKPLGGAVLSDTFNPEANGDGRGKGYTLTFTQPPQLKSGQTYYLTITLRADDPLAMTGALSISYFGANGTVQQYLPEAVNALTVGQRFANAFQLPKPSGQDSDKPSAIPDWLNFLQPAGNPPAILRGAISKITVDHLVDWEANPAIKTVQISLVDQTTGGKMIGKAELRNAFLPTTDPRGGSYVFTFSPAVDVEYGHTYGLWVDFVQGPGRLALYGSKQATETSWDDALPVSLDGYDAYDYSMGIYRSDLNFEMYWDDDAAKLTRFQSILDQTDYIFISSNRQWGTTVRIPERYPLTTLYYRDLMGCPPNKDVTWCYSVAEPGMFQGNLGFELVKTVASEPRIAGLTFNSQFAEEAFSVYDHPKVLIFRKTSAYNSDVTRTILGSVDLSKVIHLTPRKAASFSGTMMLPTDRLAEQQAGGTWSELFHADALFNTQPGVGAALWYVVIMLLGWVMWPFTRLALRGLPDRGYPFARLVAMLTLAYLVWLAGSAGIAFSALTITLIFLVLLGVNAAIAYVQREILLKELRERWRYYLLVEGVMLGLFLLFLGVRLGNPDLWHPYKGGEKPMDFSYFNAVLKSTTFPPYDPWFAGGYINYYYFGFVLVGVPVKWLGIVPAIAYNLILPTLFGLLGLGGFSVGWNLLESTRLRKMSDGQEVNSPYRSFRALFGSIGAWTGLAAVAALQILGNWGTVRMIWHGIQRLATMDVPFEQANLGQHLLWTVQGFFKLLAGAQLPYPPGDWYWIPSRVYPGEPITEFPAFSFLYADPHAHLMALPITLLALGWALSVLLGKWGWKGWGHILASFFVGGLAIGALWPTNTWDWPTYLAIGCVAVAYTALRYGNACCLPWEKFPWGDQLMRHVWWRKIILAVAGVGALGILSVVMFLPYRQWYGSGYNALDIWSGDHSPFWSYMTHWGGFLFFIGTWLAYESIDWMVHTPLSAIRKPEGGWKDRFSLYLGFGGAILATILILSALMLFKGIEIGWLALPMAAWAGLLLFRPGQPDAKRAVLFLVGTALVLTLFVEMFVLRGDLGRMNTVFKFYLQAWTLLAISAAASLIWLLPGLARIRLGWLRAGWQVAAMVLVFGLALFPLLAGQDKINDRMAPTAPHTLDGMAYMNFAHYGQEGYDKQVHDMDLSADYRAIRWMQANVPGSPVIVEANTPEYRWGTRFTIYTGLPGVVGWNWHQRQQRAITPDTWVYERIDAVGNFYQTLDVLAAQDFLRKYNVHYIVVGTLERVVYPPDGLAKFAQMDGKLWQSVYHDGDTVIYQVK